MTTDAVASIAEQRASKNEELLTRATHKRMEADAHDSAASLLLNSETQSQEVKNVWISISNRLSREAVDLRVSAERDIERARGLRSQ